MVHPPPGGAPTPAWGEDERQPQVLTDERGRRYALIPLVPGADREVPLPRRASTTVLDTRHAIAAWGLTPREADVALRVARGLPNKRIAHECGIREGTVKSHIHRLFNKLHASSRVELVLRLQEGGHRDD